MKKLKKICCRASLAFGTMTLLALFLIFSQSAYATGTVQDNNQDENQRVTDETRQELGELSPPNTQTAERGTTNGFNVSWNNEEGNLSANIRILLVLTVGAFYSDYAHVLYQNYYCAAFCKDCSGNSNGTA